MDKEFLNGTPEERSILIVGDGDFSFSVAFALHYPDVKLTATTLEKDDLMTTKYPDFLTNISYLCKRGVNVFTGVDATRLHEKFGNQLFTHIIFNFPHVGGKSNIKKNRQLIDEFFRSACKQITECNGVVIVTLCNGQGGTGADNPRREWCNSWQVTAKAANSGFILHSVEEFEGKVMFEHYSSTGFRSQNKRFHTEGSLVHKFVKHPAVLQPSLRLEPMPWFTEKCLLVDLITSLQDCWGVIQAPNVLLSCNLSSYSDLYFPNRITFTRTSSANELGTICYGDDFQLSVQESTIQLTRIKDPSVNDQFLCGRCASGGRLEVFASDMLTHLFHTGDIRCFTNGFLGIGNIKPDGPGRCIITKGKPASVYPPEYRFDISFWLSDCYSTTEFLQFVYVNSNHLVKEVTLIDTFKHPDSDLTSHCYKIIYQSLDGPLSYSQAYLYYQFLREHVAVALNVSLR